jgi:hypothetical protein
VRFCSALRPSANQPEATIEHQTQLEGPGTPLSGTGSLSSAGNGIVIARFGAQASSARTGSSGTVQWVANPAAPAGLRPQLSNRCR